MIFPIGKFLTKTVTFFKIFTDGDNLLDKLESITISYSYCMSR